MKKKSLLLIVSLSFFMIMSSLSPAAYAAEEEPDSNYIGEVTVTCSSGISGRCLKIRFTDQTYDSIIKYYCDFTGSMSNYCPLYLIKAINIFFDYVI